MENPWFSVPVSPGNFCPALGLVWMIFPALARNAAAQSTHTQLYYGEQHTRSLGQAGLKGRALTWSRLLETLSVRSSTLFFSSSSSSSKRFTLSYKHKQTKKWQVNKKKYQKHTLFKCLLSGLEIILYIHIYKKKNPVCFFSLLLSVKGTNLTLDKYKQI